MMSKQVMTLKAKRKAIMVEIAGTFKRSKDPRPKLRRANLTWQLDTLDRKIRQARKLERHRNRQVLSH
jgi:hypothetical protein